jgi:hypothetical protein
MQNRSDQNLIRCKPDPTQADPMQHRSEPIALTYPTLADPMQNRSDQNLIRCKPDPTEADPMQN